MVSHRNDRRWLDRFVDGAYALGALVLVLFAIGLLCIGAGAWGLATRRDASRITDTKAMASLDEIGRSLCGDIAGVVRPAIARTKRLAVDPRIAAAIARGDRSRQTEACNQAIAASKDIDAIALFDARGKILAINTQYVSGEPIATERVDRVMGMSFDHREIIQRCMRNGADDQVLEFQTTCDITPALFDSTGLSVAYSVPVKDPATGGKIGVVSSRLRFDRLTDLIKTTTIGGNPNAVQFVTDRGEYFSEEIDSGRASPPIPQKVLADIVAPLVSWKTQYCFTRSGEKYLSLFKLNDFVTNKGDGIQVLVLADQSWLAGEAQRAWTKQSAQIIGAGLLLLILAAMMQMHGVAPLRRNARSRAALAAVVESSDDAIVGETLDGRIQSWNAGAECMFGHRAKDVVGKRLPMLHVPDQIDEIDTVRNAVGRGPHFRYFETEFTRNDGERIAIALSISPIRDLSGKIIGISKIARDITERKQMEAELAKRDYQLRQSQKLEAVGSLAGGISHEFNNLLQVIRGYGQYAMQGLPLEDQRRKDLEQVVSAADRAAALTRQLLGFSRLQVLERTCFDHREVVNDLANLLRPLIGEHIELDIVLSRHADLIHADRGLVQQMLLNLCINARDSMPNGGGLTLKTERVRISEKYSSVHPNFKPGLFVAFSVTDTGSGMAPEVKQRIFEPFFTTKGVGQGTGLGLAMVYGCVQQHGGIINVYSEIGLGTAFKIFLPVTAGADPHVAPQECPPASGGNETILIAEDESMVRELAVRILEGAGYSVLVAADGAEAVELYEANADRISLLLFDAIMPKMTGHQAYDRIKRIDPDLPAIFCSGYDPETSQVKSLADKGCQMVQKPYDPDVLLKVVREVLDQSRSPAALCGA